MSTDSKGRDLPAVAASTDATAEDAHARRSGLKANMLARAYDLVESVADLADDSPTANGGASHVERARRILTRFSRRWRHRRLPRERARPTRSRTENGERP
jgi:hypothetical protein